LSSNTEEEQSELFKKRLELIQAFVPKFSKGGSPSDFKDVSILRRVASSVYSEIYVDLVSRFDQKTAMHHLRNIGSKVADRLYNVFEIHSKKYLKIKNIFPEIAKQLYNVKLKVIDIEKDKKYNIVQSAILSVENCILCTGLPPLENAEIHYCLPIEAFYENFYNLIAAAHKEMKPRLVQIKTIRSVGGGAKTCDYKLTTYF